MKTSQVYRRIEKAGPDECWHWDGPEVITHKGWNKTPHRAVYERSHRQTSRLTGTVRRTCGTDTCCNPRHLEEVGRLGKIARASMKLRPRTGMVSVPLKQLESPLTLGEELTLIDELRGNCRNGGKNEIRKKWGLTWKQLQDIIAWYAPRLQRNV